MNRRSFLGALATAVIAPAAPRRVYSFLWDNPLVRPVTFKIMAQVHDVTYVEFDYKATEQRIYGMLVGSGLRDAILGHLPLKYMPPRTRF